MLKILQARPHLYLNHELPDVQAGFWNGRGTRDQIANICWIMVKAREFKIQWTSGSIITNKARYDGIPAELFKILRDDVVQVLHSLCQQIWKIQQWPQDWKRSDFISIPRRAMPDNFPTTVQLHSLHMLTRICSKCFKIGFSSI